MKKRTRSLIILLVVLCVLVGVYVGITLKQKADEKAAAEEDDSIYIGNVTGADTVSYYVEGNLTTFKKDADGVWSVDGDPDFPLDQGYLTRIATAVSGLTAVREIEIAEELSSYGLAEPSNILTVSGGGNTLTLLIGRTSVDGYFAMEDGGNVIYTVASTIPGYLTTGLLEMAKTDTMETVSEDEAEDILLSRGDKSFEFLKVGKANGSATWYSAENGERSEQIAAITPAGETELTSSEILSKVVSTVNAQTFDTLVTYKPDAAELSEYGLDESALTVTVSYEKELDDGVSEKGSYTLLVGASLGDGTYYAKLKDSYLIYTIAEDDVKYFFTAMDAFGK